MSTKRTFGLLHGIGHMVTLVLILTNSIAYSATFDETIKALTPLTLSQSRSNAERLEKAATISSIIAQWSGRNTDEGLNQVLDSVNAEKEHFSILSWLFTEHYAEDRRKGDLLAMHILSPHNDEQRRLLNYFANPDLADASLSLRQALISELDDDVEIAVPGEAEPWPTNNLAYNILVSYADEHELHQEKNFLGFAPTTTSRAKYEWIAKLRAVIAAHPDHFAVSTSASQSPNISAVDQPPGSGKLPVVAPNRDESNSTPTGANEEPTSSTPWLVVAVLIVAALGLLWLLLKRRS